MTNMLSVDENESPLPGQLDADDFVKEVSDNLRKARGHWSDWRNEARESYDFFASIQWTDEDIGKLNEEGRPAVVFNRIVRTINAVSGVELQNRQEIRYYPRNIDLNQQNPDDLTDSGYSEILNNAAKWVREQNNAEDEESEAFEDCLISGIGWTETKMDYDTDPEGMIAKDRIDPLQMLVDPNSTKRNFSDARWIACIKDFTKKEAQKMFPGLDNVEAGSFWGDQDGLVHDQQDEWKYINDYSDQIAKIGMVSVIQYQYWVKEPNYVVLTSDGNIINFDSKRYNAAKDIIDFQAKKIIKKEKKIFKEVFIVGNKLADKTDLGCDHFTFEAITGLRNRNKGVWFGLVHLMKDPQRWANKWLSQIQHIINSNSKGGLLVETGAVKNIRKLEDEWASPAGIIHLNPGGLDKIREKQAAQYPDGIDRLLNYAVNAINDIPGVNLEMLGMANRDQPIGLEDTRKQAGIAVLASFFDSLRRYRKVDGRILMYYIREYIADGRLIRISGPGGAKYIPLLRDKMAFEYDIVVDDSPTSANVKETVFNRMAQIIPMALQAGIPIPPDILKYANLPEDLIYKWMELINQNNQPDPAAAELKQIQLLMAKLSAMQVQANIENTGSSTAKNYASAEKDKAVGQEQSALAMQKYGVLQGNQSMKVAEMNRDQERKDLELYLKEQRKLLEIQLTDQFKHMQHATSLNQIQ